MKSLEPEISLGDYAREVRIRHSADEYMRLLAQEEPENDAVTRQANTPIRYHEIVPSLAAPMDENKFATTAKKDKSAAAEKRIAVTVRRGDTLWRLARTYLGSGARWQSISFLNHHRGSPHVIRAGEVVLVPDRNNQRVRGTQFAKRFSRRLPR